MTEVDVLAKKFKKAGEIIAGAGIIPIPVTNTLTEILKFYLDEEDLDFIALFRSKTSMAIDQILKKANIPEEEIKRKAEKLAKKGFIFNQPNSEGVIVYRLLPIVVVGTFEYTFMKDLPKGIDTEKYQKLAKLYEKLMEELRDKIQDGYDNILPIFKAQPATDRTIPLYDNVNGGVIDVMINKMVAVEEQIVPAQTVEEIINKFDDIAVGNCFCRNYSQMLQDPCKINAPSEVCFTFGKSARHTIAQGFARKVTKEEAIKILKQAEDAGLVHKAFHNGSDLKRDENSICNCCKCCCDTFKLWRNGALPMTNSTNFLSIINEAECIGCGTCVEKCPVDAIKLNSDNIAERNADYCIGCGICAHFCPQNAIALKKGMRKVFVPPPRLRTN